MIKTKLRIEGKYCTVENLDINLSFFSDTQDLSFWKKCLVGENKRRLRRLKDYNAFFVDVEKCILYGLTESIPYFWYYVDKIFIEYKRPKENKINTRLDWLNACDYSIHLFYSSAHDLKKEVSLDQFMKELKQIMINELNLCNS